MPRIVTSICGVCPWSHHLAAAKACDGVFGVKPALAGAMQKAAPSQSDAWRGLDTAILHEIVLKGLLGLSQAQASLPEVVGYTKDVGEVFSLVASSSYRAGFVLRPTRMEQVRQTAENGERMPQKSTYFSPKLLSGLVMRRL
jgi:uncharacterized protein (DUF1015 family)